MPRRHPTSERRLPLRQPPAELPFSAPFPKCEPSQKWLGSPAFGTPQSKQTNSRVFLPQIRRLTVGDILFSHRPGCRQFLSLGDDVFCRSAPQINRFGRSGRPKLTASVRQGGNIFAPRKVQDTVDAGSDLSWSTRRRFNFDEQGVSTIGWPLLNSRPCNRLLPAPRHQRPMSFPQLRSEAQKECQASTKLQITRRVFPEGS